MEDFVSEKEVGAVGVVTYAELSSTPATIPEVGQVLDVSLIREE